MRYIKVKTHHGDNLLYISIYYFLGGALLNFNNVNIKKDFPNVFEYYDSPLHKEITC
jgi:hypothetical protein